MNHPNHGQSPKFLKEAFETDAEAAEDAAELLSLTAAPPSLDSLGRAKAELLSQISQEPFCYAPFFSRLSRLFELEEEATVALMTDIAWKKAPLPGISTVDVVTTLSRPGVDAGLVRFEPGVHYPRHKHAALEQNLILSGGYTDDLGRHYGPGDLHEMAAGTEHEFWVDKDQPCIVGAVSDSRILWTSPVLKLLSYCARLFKR